MTWFTLIAETLLALAKALGLALSTRQVSQERAAGAAQQRVEDLTHESERIAKASRAGLAVDASAGKLPDPFDRDCGC